MGGNSVLTQLLKGVGFYSKSFAFFLVLAAITIGVASWRPLQADDGGGSSAEGNATFDLVIQMQEDGSFYLGQEKIGVEVVTGEETYRYRYQILDRPREPLATLSIAVKLPKPLPEQSIGHRFINNGGAAIAESALINPQTLVFYAEDIGMQAQLTFEIEVPKSYVAATALRSIQEMVAGWPPYLWAIISTALPVMTALILLMVALARNRKLPTSHFEPRQDAPSRLAPAMLGILLRGRLSSRDIAATLLDLARRGHLIIRQVSNNDFRFSRRNSHDHLEDFERILLDQIFGPVSDRTTSEEISFTLAQELFSKRMSQAFMLAYQKVNDLGYFYTNPLTLHRRYQVIGILFFLLAVTGFFLNIFVFNGFTLFLLFWVGMMVSALLIYTFSRNLPSRTVFGDRELAKWMLFGEYLTDNTPVDFSAHSQEKYLAYLPYAVVLEAEADWTKRFYELPFTAPTWYLAPRITTVDEFANRVFPLFGYLSHTLALSTAPASR